MILCAALRMIARQARTIRQLLRDVQTLEVALREAYDAIAEQDAAHSAEVQSLTLRADVLRDLIAPEMREFVTDALSSIDRWADR